MTDTRYVDSQGRRKIYPASTSKCYREMKREIDPFPAGKMIGGKRYWIVQEVLDWLARQDDPAPSVAVSREAAPEDDAVIYAEAAEASVAAPAVPPLAEAEPRQAAPVGA